MLHDCVEHANDLVQNMTKCQSRDSFETILIKRFHMNRGDWMPLLSYTYEYMRARTHTHTACELNKLNRF